jgi:iron complex outermembrane receptor protein
VIVTAQKRPEDVQTVPISLAAFSAEDLTQLGMTEGFDLPNQVPNMNVDRPVGDSAVRYFIRGVGTQDFSTLATSPVAVYLDDVYLGSTIANSVNLYDVQRVEVLLGPQGTLWGKNATGGAIDFISAHPTQTLAFEGSGGYGNLGDRFVRGMFNTPILADLAVRAAFTYSGRDAWIQNLAPDGPHNLDAYNKAGGRLSLEWTPSTQLTVFLKGEYLKRTGSTNTGHMVPLNGRTDAFGNPALPLGIVNLGGGPSSDDFDTWDATGRLDWTLGDLLRLTSISAWLDVHRIHEYELDGGTPTLLLNQALFGRHSQFTEELRLASEPAGPLRWQAGLLYYFASETATTASPFNQSVPGAVPIYVTTDLWPEARKFNSNSVFGGGEYDLNPQVTIKGGLRYNEDEGSYHAVHYAIYPYANYLNYLNPDPLADPNSMLIPSDTINARANWSKLTWDTGVRYRFSSDKMLYLDVGTGYRQGTFSSPSGSTPEQFAILRPESNFAVEIGAKTSWLDNHLQVNAAAFNYQYTDMQVFLLQPITAGAPIFIERNAGKAADRGAEVEFKSVPGRGWLISGDIGYVHAVFTEFNTENGAGEPISLAGNRFPRQPQWTASALLQYRFEVATGAVLLQTDWNYRADYYVNADNLHNPYIPGRTIGNARAAYSPVGAHWEVAAWAQNITDKHYPMGGYRLGLTNADVFYFGDPLTYGVSATVRF